MPCKPTTPESRFWPRVDTSGDCWIWLGGARNGYGRISRRKGESDISTHRLSYELAYGPIPAGLYVCHRCDVKLCVNPAHLFLGSAADNNRDARQKGLAATGDRTGPRTHPESYRGDRHWSRRRPERVLRGERNGRAKLTDAQVAAMRTRYSAGGVTQVELAREYGVSQPHVSALLLRQQRIDA